MFEGFTRLNEDEIDKLENNSEEWQVARAEYFHTGSINSRVIDSLQDTEYFIRNIKSFLELEKNVKQKGQLLICFPNNYGASILYDSKFEDEYHNYIFAKIVWEDSQWKIDEQFAQTYGCGYPFWTDIKTVKDFMQESASIGREGLWGLSSKEYDVIWKMRLGF